MSLGKSCWLWKSLSLPMSNKTFTVHRLYRTCSRCWEYNSEQQQMGLSPCGGPVLMMKTNISHHKKEDYEQLRSWVGTTEVLVFFPHSAWQAVCLPKRACGGHTHHFMPLSISRKWSIVLYLGAFCLQECSDFWNNGNLFWVIKSSWILLPNHNWLSLISHCSLSIGISSVSEVWFSYIVYLLIILIFQHEFNLRLNPLLLLNHVC